LSLLEQFEKFGYSDLITQLKELVEADRIELVGSAAYHPLLTRISNENVAKQVVLNEYGLGYYFGQRQGFEGEVSMMVKDIRGFFPPELALNTNVLNILDELNYEWVVSDDSSIPADQTSPEGVYALEGVSTKIVARDSKLSNLISFKRDDAVDDIGNYLLDLKNSHKDFVAVVLDGEVFGHHSKEGLYLLEAIIDSVASLDISLTTVSEALSSIEPATISKFNESTWSDGGDPYALWDTKGNKLQESLWKLSTLIEKSFSKISAPKSEEGFENIATWKESDLEKITDPALKDFVLTELLVLKSMHSDQYWWSSRATVYDKVLYSPTMVKNALVIYKKLAARDAFVDVAEKIHQMSADISEQIA
jgi:predicted glycosyl hydrolase (DUF1957 family)